MQLVLIWQVWLRFHGCSYIEVEREKVVADKLIILCVDRLPSLWVILLKAPSKGRSDRSRNMFSLLRGESVSHKLY